LAPGVEREIDRVVAEIDRIEAERWRNRVALRQIWHDVLFCLAS